ncbi:MAG: STAS domain-containing protein [Opitutales bacterium]|nr:STAS domain-containing protein [Opitutales bacterium]
MSGGNEAVFDVNVYSDPVLLKISGRACFSNCSPVKDFFKTMIGRGTTRFVVDFQDCVSMDSTFLGILAGAGLQLMRRDPPGRLILVRLGTRNLELVRNLGLHRILVVDDGDAAQADQPFGQTRLEPGREKASEVENARLVLRAHEDLIEVDEGNRAKFQDVISFLKNQVDDS